MRLSAHATSLTASVADTNWRRARVLTVTVWCVGAVHMAVLGPPFETSPIEVCGPSLGETTPYEVRTLAWPPGVLECRIQLGPGSAEVRRVLPWATWVAIALLGVAAGAGAAAFSAGRLRLELAAACLALGLGALVAFFVRIDAGVVVAGAGTGLLAIAHVARRSQAPGSEAESPPQ